MSTKIEAKTYSCNMCALKCRIEISCPSGSPPFRCPYNGRDDVWRPEDDNEISTEGTEGSEAFSVPPGWYRHRHFPAPMRKVTQSSNTCVVYEENGSTGNEESAEDFIKSGWELQEVTPLDRDEMLSLSGCILILGYSTEQPEYCCVVNATGKTVSVINSEGDFVKYTAAQLLTCDVRDSICPDKPMGKISSSHDKRKDLQ